MEVISKRSIELLSSLYNSACKFEDVEQKLLKKKRIKELKKEIRQLRKNK
jgi:hypothetical protein